MPTLAKLYQWSYNRLGVTLVSKMRRYLGQKLYRFVRDRRWVGTEGTFRYSTEKGTVLISFDARNTQFDALFDRASRFGYEIETSVILDLLSTGDKVFYDIGSNWGYFSLMLASKPGFTGKILAFEPFPPSFRDLHRTIEQAGLAQRIQPIPLALSDCDGEGKMHLPDGFHSGFAQLSNSHRSDELPVKVARLDSLGLPPPSFMKIDVEGNEPRVIRGGEKIIAKYKPHIVFEHYRFGLDFSNAIFETLKVLGYSFFLPALEFRSGNSLIRVTTGEDFGSFIDRYGSFTLALIPFETEDRCLLPNQLTILAAHRKNNHAIKPYTVRRRKDQGGL